MAQRIEAPAARCTGRLAAHAGSAPPRDATRRRAFLAAAGAALALVWPAVQARNVEGHVYDETVVVARVPLVLNGAGVRSRLWFKAFTVGLYLPQRATQVGTVLEQHGAKRLRVRTLLKLPGKEFAKALRRGVEKNHTEAEQAVLSARLGTLAARIEALGELQNGDAVDLDYTPGEGLTMRLNGVLRGDAVPGEDLYRALLKIFIGDRPAQVELKSALLGGPQN